MARVSRNKITMIPYGAPEVLQADASLLPSIGVAPGRYAVVIARPEPENSVLDIVRAFSRKPRGYKLVMLGRYEPDQNAFHKSVLDAASEEVIFPGAIYDRAVVEALRFHARFYIHGHRVGGTNPSLVEALGAGSAVLAHDNHFNRWVAGRDAAFFKDEDQCADLLETLWNDDQAIAGMRIASKKRFLDEFTWTDILAQHETLLLRWTTKPEISAPELLNLSTPDITSYGDMDASMMSRMKELEDENRRLKEMHAEMELQVIVLKEAMQKSGEVEETISQP